MPNRLIIAAALLLQGGCGWCGSDRAEYGGPPLLFDLDREAVEMVADDPCWRRERGGWHYSIAHCEKMGSVERITGVFVTGFEERSFIEGARGLPDPQDPRRFRQEIELDEERIHRAIRHRPVNPNGEAYRLTFIGRRQLEPRFDCYGGPNFAFVAERLVWAEYIGPMKPLPDRWWEQPGRFYKTYGGRWGELQAEGIRQCEARQEAAQ